jgi:hypothetical protein
MGADAPGFDPVVVVAHEEVGVGARDRGGGRHPRPELVRLRRDRDLRIGHPHPQRRTQSTDERPEVEDVLHRERLDIDIDAIEPLLLHEIDEDLDPARLGLGLRVELAVLARPEARVHELDPLAPFMGNADQVAPDRPGDGSIPLLPVIELAIALVGDREEGQRRQVGRADVIDDRLVHLPVRQEAIDLVTRDRDDRGERRRPWQGGTGHGQPILGPGHPAAPGDGHRQDPAHQRPGPRRLHDQCGIGARDPTMRAGRLVIAQRYRLRRVASCGPENADGPSR